MLPDHIWEARLVRNSPLGLQRQLPSHPVATPVLSPPDIKIVSLYLQCFRINQHLFTTDCSTSINKANTVIFLKHCLLSMLFLYDHIATSVVEVIGPAAGRTLEIVSTATMNSISDSTMG